MAPGEGQPEKLKGSWEEEELYFLRVHFLCKVDPNSQFLFIEKKP